MFYSKHILISQKRFYFNKKRSSLTILNTATTTKAIFAKQMSMISNIHTLINSHHNLIWNSFS